MAGETPELPGNALILIPPKGILMGCWPARRRRSQVTLFHFDPAERDFEETHEPVQIVGKRNSAVLVSEEDWRAAQETLYLTSIPGTRESIREGISTAIKACDKEPGW